MSRRACSSRRSRNSRATGRRNTTGARSRRKLNALPQFITEIDGLDIHFIHVRSKHENALPVIVTHGWPGSVIEQLKIIDPLVNPTAHGGKRIGRFPCGDSVDAGLRILRQADRDRLGPRAHRTCLGGADEAPRVHAIRGARRRLGRGRHRPDGRASAAGIDRHSHQHARRRSARHRQGASRAAPRRRPVSPPRRRSPYERLQFFYAKGVGYALEMGLRPQTLYGIADSPVGLAA